MRILHFTLARLSLLPLVALLTSGCDESSTQRAHPRSATQDCWEEYESRRRAHALGRAFQGASDGYSGRSSSTAHYDNDESLQGQRCLQVEQHERTDRRARDAEDAEHERRASAERRQQDEQRASIRRRPKPPELRGTPAEASALCTKQMGKIVADDTKLSCQVGGVPVFTCTIDSQQRFDRCDTYFEDGDVLEFRKASEDRFGPATSESISPQGFRVWVWKAGNTTVAVGMYARGVRTSIMLEGGEPSERPAAGESSGAK